MQKTKKVYLTFFSPEVQQYEKDNHDELIANWKVKFIEDLPNWQQYVLAQYRKHIAQKDRLARLMPEGIPKYLRIYDNGGETLDRYTIVFTNLDANNYYPYVAASLTGAGFYQHGEGNTQPIDRPTYGHLGKKITFAALGKELQELIINDYCDYWELTKPQIA